GEYISNTNAPGWRSELGNCDENSATVALMESGNPLLLVSSGLEHTMKTMRSALVAGGVCVAWRGVGGSGQPSLVVMRSVWQEHSPSAQAATRQNNPVDVARRVACFMACPSFRR